MARSLFVALQVDVAQMASAAGDSRTRLAGHGQRIGTIGFEFVRHVEYHAHVWQIQPVEKLHAIFDLQTSPVEVLYCNDGRRALDVSRQLPVALLDDPLGHGMACPECAAELEQGVDLTPTDVDAILPLGFGVHVLKGRLVGVIGRHLDATVPAGRVHEPHGARVAQIVLVGTFDELDAGDVVLGKLFQRLLREGSVSLEYQRGNGEPPSDFIRGIIVPLLSHFASSCVAGGRKTILYCPRK